VQVRKVLHRRGSALVGFPALAIGAVLAWRMTMRASVLVLLATVLAGCVTVKPWQRERLAGTTMQFEMAPFAEAQQGSVVEITEGGTFGSAGPGSAGAGCGCH
jgi:hypothetical protein